MNCNRSVSIIDLGREHCRLPVRCPLAGFLTDRPVSLGTQVGAPAAEQKLLYLGKVLSVGSVIARTLGLKEGSVVQLIGARA